MSGLQWGGGGGGGEWVTVGGGGWAVYTRAGQKSFF